MENLDDNRERMVTEQLAGRGVANETVLNVFRRVPRHRFVPEKLLPEAYDDRPLPIGSGQTISQPFMVAFMTELLNLKPADRVLEIGTGSGYQTAILASLAGQVVTIERHAELQQRARKILHELEFTNITYICGDGSLGWSEGAPYDAILVTAGSPQLPPALIEQLVDGGRLLCPVGDRLRQQLKEVIKQGSGFETKIHTECVFVPLTGEGGWPEEIF